MPRLSLLYLRSMVRRDIRSLPYVVPLPGSITHQPTSTRLTLTVCYLAESGLPFALYEHNRRAAFTIITCSLYEREWEVEVH